MAEFIALARAARARDVPVVMVLSLPGSEQLIPQDLRGAVRLIEVRQFIREAGRAVHWLGGAARRAGRLARRIGMTVTADFIETAEAVLRGHHCARALARRHGRPAALAVADDRDIRFDAGVLRYARRHGIRTVSVSFGRSDPSADAMRRQQGGYHILGRRPGRLLKAWMAKASPAEVRDASGRAMVFTAPGSYLAAALMGVRLPCPWSYGGGRAERVAVQDFATAQSLIQLGTPAAKIAVTGQCSQDALWRGVQNRAALRADIVSRARLDPDLPLIMCALPALGEHQISSAADQARESEFLVRTLAAAGANVLLSLHPRQRAADYEDLAARYGVHLLSEPLSAMLPAADVFVAYSSTLEWAQLLGIPAVALEHFELGYTLFSDRPGIVCVTRRDELLPVLQRMVSDPDAARREAMKALHERQGLLDGRASDRVLDLMLGRGEGAQKELGLSLPMRTEQVDRP